MMEEHLYPLKFYPHYLDKIWGGSKMTTFLNKEITPLSKCGESWEVSGIVDEVSIVKNGFLAENDLNELIEIYMGDLVGDKVYEECGLGFPLLIKFIDAAEDLSVQVHPTDELAQKLYKENGKNELWYVLQADAGAGLYVGFKKGVTKPQYEQAVREGTVDKLLNFYEVKAGDVFFIPAGTIHAIGKGVLLTEIQQASDITYRIFDWNRIDEQGNSRTLHTREALRALDFSAKQNYAIPYQEIANQSVSIIRNNYFNINLLSFDIPMQKDYISVDSFVIYICLEGEVHHFGNNIRESLSVGEVCLVPAEVPDLTLVPAKKSKVLEVYY
ncbi:MAG: class I mannose-6-phosphate isomerase [Bacteroidales bacterium]|jgi:mannose-6-phosphate isomerase|nr:class I mannose-6-phosphate isomerase [Bacteroidales bacterium]